MLTSEKYNTTIDLIQYTNNRNAAIKASVAQLKAQLGAKEVYLDKSDMVSVLLNISAEKHGSDIKLTFNYYEAEDTFSMIYPCAPDSMSPNDFLNAYMKLNTADGERFRYTLRYPDAGFDNLKDVVISYKNN